MKLSKNAMEVLNKRYLKKNDDGKVIETPEEMFDRVAKYIAKAYVKDTELNFSDAYTAFYDMMANLDFLPNTPTLLNAGTVNPQLFACFFLQIEDSMDSIFGTLHKASLIFQSGGGCGFDFSKIRPKGDSVHGNMGVASGVLSFMRVYDTSAEIIKSGGSRRAALMAVLRVDHPEILDFIQCKLNEKMYNNFNISVAITDKFMEAVKNDSEYDIVNPRTNMVVDKYKAREVFELLCSCSNRSGEPGVIFIDTVNKDDHSPELGPITGCNPCVTGNTLIAVADGRGAVSIKQLAEEGKDVPVYCYDGKNIVVKIGRNPRLTRENAEVVVLILNDNSVMLATKDHKVMLSDGSYQPLGNMGLDKSFMPYNSECQHVKDVDYLCNEFYEPVPKDVYNLTVDDVHNFAVITNKDNMSGIIVSNCGEIFLHSAASCVLGSINLGNMIYEHIDGSYYVDWDKLRNTVRYAVNFLDASIDANQFPIEGSEKVAKYTREIGLGIMGWADMLAKLGIQYDSQQALDLAEQVMAYIQDCAQCASEKLSELNKPGRNPNRGLTAIAPTGTRAMIADCSYGAEPYFSICHRKNVMDKTLYVTNPLFEQMLKDHGIYSEELMDKVAGQQSIQDIEEIPEDIRLRFRTAYDVSPEYHIKMQAAFQKHISNAISKSVNMRNDATVEDVKNAYLLAYELGCKGITVYRDGSRSIQVVDAGHEKCPECGGKVDRKEKCSSCVDCGWSKCNL